MEANGVTPIPAPIRTACSARNIALVAVPYGPLINTWMSIKKTGYLIFILITIDRLESLGCFCS